MTGTSTTRRHGRRVDIFPGSPDVIDQARVSGICGRHLRALGPDAILAHKLETLAHASHERPVDEKHYRDARLLGPVCGRKVPEIPPACLCREAYSPDTSAECVRCSRSAIRAFPLAPKHRILEVLGYV